MSSSKYTWLIDAGHGGIDDYGIYNTPGKQYHFVQEPISIYEGDINRKIANRLIKRLEQNNISYVNITPGTDDIPLSKRVATANHLHKTKGNTIYISIHSNAVSNTTKGYGSNATGYEIFTSVGQTESDKVAEVFLKTYMKYFTNVRARVDNSDGDLDKEAQFYVLRKTIGPAILIENLFYDNIKEAKYLLSEQGQDYIAAMMYRAIEAYESQS